MPKKTIWGGLGILFLIFVFSGNDSSNQEIIENTEEQASVLTSIENIVDEVIPVEETEVRDVDVIASSSNQTDKLYEVTSVIDGDTIKVDLNGKIETVRFIGIDTPETVHPSKPVECFGKEASDKVKSALTGKKVLLEFDSTQGERDTYNRLLAYIKLEDGTNFNKQMIEDGYAYEYTYNLPYKYQSEFKTAETSAKSANRGLWADGVCEEKIETTAVTKPQTKTFTIPAVTPTPTSKPTSQTSYTCSYNAYNCGDFSTHAEAQGVYQSCGGVSNDIHKLDRDKDGSACETLP